MQIQGKVRRLGFLLDISYNIEYIGVYSIAIPGEVKGYFAAKKEFGNPDITMKDLLEPTIKMCEEGITVSRSLLQAINSPDTLKVIKKDPTLK